jgi:nitrogen fixation protein
MTQRCRVRIVADEISAPDSATYQMGTVIGWRLKKTTTEYPQSQYAESEEPMIVEKEETVWSLAMDKGGELEVNALDLPTAIIRAKKWKHQYPGYVEHDSPLFTYRNKLGRFCGRAADAPYAGSRFFFSKLMLKREQEYYTSLKNRSYDNNWGGKMGLRNAWILSVKENFDDLSTLRDGLLSLEDAFHELCGEKFEEEEEDKSSSQHTAKELLENESLRCDVELESLGLKINGLWHCRDSRAVFREIILNSKSLGIYALGLDLLCRNAQAYLEATKPQTSTRKAASNSYHQTNYDQGMYTTSGRLTRSAYSTEQQSTSRRMNSWQMQQEDY